MTAGSKHPIDVEMRWNFGDSRSSLLSLDEFLAQKEADGVEFFAGKEPWLEGLHKLNWQTSPGTSPAAEIAEGNTTESPSPQARAPSRATSVEFTRHSPTTPVQARMPAARNTGALP